MKSYLDFKNEGQLNYWRSTSDFEVDFILNEKVAIEVKAKNNVIASDLKSLRALAEEGKMKKFILVSLEKNTRKTEDKIEILPLVVFIERLWAGEFD